MGIWAEMDGRFSAVALETTAGHGDGGIVFDGYEIPRGTKGGKCSVVAGKALDVCQRGVALPLDEYGMHVLDALAQVGDDRALRYLPVAVLPLCAELVNADGDAVEVEVGELPVRLIA